MAKLTWWDVHTAGVSRRSSRWAITDRGWLHRDGERTALGHYLDYGPCGEHHRKRPDGAVHAVVCAEGLGCKASAWFKTPDEARAWIEAETGAGVCKVNPRSRI